MMRRLLLLAALCAALPSASAQTGAGGLGSLGAAVDSLALADSAAWAAEGAALDTLLSDHPDVLARHLARADAALPWWKRWAVPLGFGAALLLLVGVGVWAYRRLTAAIAEAEMTRGLAGASLTAATRAVERADATVAALNRDATARLADLHATRDAIEAQLGQTRNLLDRAERLGLFHASFAQAMAQTPPGLTDPSSDPET